MQSDRYSLKESFVLHRRNFRETSLLLDIFSREHGIFRLIAKGAMRGKGGRSGVLQPFLPLSLAWTSRGEPAILTGAEARGNIFELAGKNLFCGFYLNELLVKLLPPHDPHERIFDCYTQSLQRLESGLRLDETLRFFELALLEELGYGLLLDCEAENGTEIRADLYYAYRIEQGPVECKAGDGAISGTVLLGLRNGFLTGPEETLSAKRLLRRVLHHYLGGRPLNSRALFKYSTSHKRDDLGDIQ